MPPDRCTARPRAASPACEFPILAANGLYASPTKGDGNCLFNALSDQLYGHEGEHRALRDATIAYMRANADFYRPYMAVNNTRRNPKRKATACSNRIDTAHHSETELQTLFDLHVEKMGQPGEWADNMEISAFASALNVHVRLWHTDYVYLCSPHVFDDSNGDSNGDSNDQRAVLNVAYHTWEHYSSVRNVAGPHTGLPNVTVNPTTISKKRSSFDCDDYSRHASRATKRRSPLPLFDSDSTPPESSESSSDESNPSFTSSQCHPEDAGGPAQSHPRLTLKLRNTRLTVPQDEAATEGPPKRHILRLPLWRPARDTPTPELPALEPTTELPPLATLIDLTDDDTTETTTTEAATPELPATSADLPVLTTVIDFTNDDETASIKPTATTWTMT